MLTRETVLRDAIELLEEHGDDFEIDGLEIDEDTRFLEDLGVESLEVTVIALATQQKYGVVFPFNDYFGRLGERLQDDLTIGEWVDFVFGHLAANRAMPLESDLNA